MSGAERIAKERQRQIDAEGWTAEHDDEHDNDEMAMAAACYAASDRILVREEFANEVHFVDAWPWDRKWDARPYHDHGNVVTPEKATPAQRIRLLEKAGALCAAEIDRLLRKKARPPQGDGTAKEG